MKPLSLTVCVLAIVLIGLMSPSVWACAVCYTNNAESSLAQGAQKGVLTMLIVTYAVVIGLLAMLVFKIVRAQRRQVVDHAC